MLYVSLSGTLLGDARERPQPSTIRQKLSSSSRTWIAWRLPRRSSTQWSGTFSRLWVRELHHCGLAASRSSGSSKLGSAQEVAVWAGISAIPARLRPRTIRSSACAGKPSSPSNGARLATIRRRIREAPRSCSGAADFGMKQGYLPADPRAERLRGLSVHERALDLDLTARTKPALHLMAMYAFERARAHPGSFCRAPIH